MLRRDPSGSVELRALVSAPELKADMVRLRNSHRDDFMVDGVVDGERVTEALTLYSEFVGERPRRVFVERLMLL